MGEKVAKDASEANAIVLETSEVSVAEGSEPAGCALMRDGSTTTVSTDILDKLHLCVAQNAKDLRETGHLIPGHYGPLASNVASILERLGKVAGLAAAALAWPPQAISVALAEDPERFTSLDIMIDADFEEGVYPPDDFDSRTRAINGEKNSLEFCMLLFANIREKPKWDLHQCASDAYTRSLGQNMGRIEQASISFAMRQCLGDLDWFLSVLGTTRARFDKLSDAILADGAVIQDGVATLFAKRNLPYNLPNAKKNGKRRRPYQYKNQAS